ncbi:hypothetical protein P6U16_02410 [Rhizobium sp. 32-5/1]|uniref:hypothetical protein n=1 Tax=Rhizobium sp. 32-5/1 TaxID=3019602 RepID=UPI00240D2722|nr:hypothetical protein [Rhizobium sp. 32-5/1]WEZ83688.1 hypothetical protein P6U16_02410 [Rhizobium sp. 32-5/1]
MGELRLSQPACGIAGKPRLTSTDIDILREHVFAQGITSSQEAATLFAINTACTEKCPEWHHYFIDSISGFILHHCYPQGSLDERNAAWLIGMVSTGGTVNSPIELELLFHIIDVSPFVPDSLTIFALQQLQNRHAGRQGRLGRNAPFATTGPGWRRRTHGMPGHERNCAVAGRKSDRP